MNEARALLNAWETARKTGVPVVLATVVRVNGSSYRRPGAKMLITGEGEISGSVSGGCLERDLIRRALAALGQKRRQIIRYDTSLDADEEDGTGDDSLAASVRNAGLGCEGVIDILLDAEPAPTLEILKQVLDERIERTIEIHLHEKDHPQRLLGKVEPQTPSDDVFYDHLSPPIAWTIFGAGFDAVSMMSLADEMGWETTVVDCRSSFPVSRRHFAPALRVLSAAPEALPGELQVGADSIAVLMTHNYEHDKEILRQLLPRGLKYLGMLGPKVRAERLLRELKEEGLKWDEATLQALHYPAGVDVGGEGPASIALSVISEVRAVLSDRPAGFLKDRSGPIH